MIYTTNTIESLNMPLRKIIKMRGSFPERGRGDEVVVSGATERFEEMDDAGAELEWGFEPLQHLVAGPDADLHRLWIGGGKRQGK